MRRQHLSGLHPVGDLAGLSDPILARAVQSGEAYIDEDGIICPMPKAIAGFPVAPPLRGRSDGDILRALKRGTARMVKRRGELGQAEWVITAAAPRGGTDFPSWPPVAKQVYSSVFETYGSYQAFAAGASPSITVGILIPLFLPAPFLLNYGWLINGSAVSPGNFIDVAVMTYTFAPTGTTNRLYSLAGANLLVAQGTASVVQAALFDEASQGGIAPILPPGAYLLGFCFADTTANRISVVTSTLPTLKSFGLYSQTTSSTAGFGQSQAVANVASWTNLPVFGIAQRNISA